MKLWRYGRTGFEPEDILRKADRPQIDMFAYYVGEPPSGELAKTLLNIQRLLDDVYGVGYARDGKDAREFVGET